jgi:lysozyme
MLNSILDISHHNSADFCALHAAGILAVVHKASEGVSMVDKQYASRKPEALAAGLLWGAYHFGDGSVSGAAQAQHFLSVAGTGGLLVLDFEGNPSSPSMSVDQSAEFVTEVFHAIGKWPGIYCDGSHEAMEVHAQHPVIGQNCWLWIAEYGPSPKAAATWPSPWKLWQWTENGTVAGVQYDRDQFNGTEEELRTFWTDQSV